MTRSNWQCAAVLVIGWFLWHFSAALADAQYYYNAPPPAAAPVQPPPPPGYGYGAYPAYGGYWQGQAQMLDAYGNLGISQEQARIVREQANQAKLDTKVKTIDVMGYERAHKYWLSDEQIDVKAKQVQVAMNNPPIQEITSGRALNTLLGYLDRVMTMGGHGPAMPIDPQVVKSMNVNNGTSDGGNTGMLKEINNLQWPLATEGPDQKQLDSMLKQAAYDGAKGPIAPATISKMNKMADAVQQQVRLKFYNNEVDGSDYLDGNRFLERVRSAISALKQPNIASMLGGQLSCQGDTVEQVVWNMTSKGLSFTSAQPGQESAYISMHRAFVNFGLIAGIPDTGFRVRIGNPVLPGSKT